MERQEIMSRSTGWMENIVDCRLLVAQGQRVHCRAMRMIEFFADDYPPAPERLKHSMLQGKHVPASPGLGWKESLPD
jgi:hypothetical protein